MSGDNPEQRELWVDKTCRGDDVINPNVVKYLRQMIEAAESKTARQPVSAAGGVLKVDREYVSIFSSAPPAFIDVAANTLGRILGAPISDEKVEHKGELENRSVHFPCDISIVYMLSRGDGISINIPRKSIPMLKQKMQTLGLLEATGHAQSS